MAKLQSGTTVYGNLTVNTYVTATGNITGGNVLTVGNVSATGNVTGGNIIGNYLFGNGTFITGLNAGSAAQIANGATNITIPVASGNVAMSVAGQANTVVISLGSFTMYGSFATPKALVSNVIVAPNVNAILFGPVTISNGSNITVDATSSLYVYGSLLIS